MVLEGAVVLAKPPAIEAPPRESLDAFVDRRYPGVNFVQDVRHKTLGGG